MITVVRKTHIYYFSCLKFFKYVLYKNEKKKPIYTTRIYSCKQIIDYFCFLHNCRHIYRCC